MSKSKENNEKSQGNEGNKRQDHQAYLYLQSILPDPEKVEKEPVREVIKNFHTLIALVNNRGQDNNDGSRELLNRDKTIVTKLVPKLSINTGIGVSFLLQTYNSPQDKYNPISTHIIYYTRTIEAEYKLSDNQEVYNFGKSEHEHIFKKPGYRKSQAGTFAHLGPDHLFHLAQFTTNVINQLQQPKQNNKPEQRPRRK